MLPAHVDLAVVESGGDEIGLQAADAIRSGLQTGFPPLTSLLVLVAYAVVFWGLAVRLFRWE